MSIAPGAELGGYVVQHPLGKGGMGQVFLALDTPLNRPVALKVINPQIADDPEIRERFIREARTAAAIEHNHVLPIYRIDHQDGFLYIVTRYVDGGDLASLVTDYGTLIPERAVEIINQIASALDAAHQQGFVHRDVKPHNILLTHTHDGADHAFLGDFGLARFLADTDGLTATGSVLGSAQYMSPEQARGKRVDALTDVYALGGALYFAVTGQPPFPAESETAMLLAHQNQPPPKPSAVTPDLAKFDAVIERALAKEPGDRYQSAGDLAAAAHAALTGALPLKAEHMVATGAAAPQADFPESPDLDWIRTQSPRMTSERFDALLGHLGEKGWDAGDIREYVHPWAPRDWKTGSR